MQYNIPNPVMWDSSAVAEQSEAAMVNVPFTFAQTTDGDWALTLTLTPDRSWLTDPARVYPILVDPPISTGPSMEEAYESNGTAVANEGRMGNSRAGSANTYWRTVACYPYGSLITSNLEVTGGYFASTYTSGTTNNQPGYLYWAMAWGFNDYGFGIDSWTVTNAWSSTTDWGIDGAYQSWVNQSQPGACIMLVGNEVPGSYTYKDTSTVLFMQNEASPAITATAPVGGVHASIMPTLSVNTTANPAGGADNYSFEVSTNSNPDVSPIWTSNGFTTSSPYMQVPINTLAPGTTYYWKASIEDKLGAIRSTAVSSFVTNSPGSISQSGSLLRPGRTAGRSPSGTRQWGTILTLKRSRAICVRPSELLT